MQPDPWKRFLLGFGLWAVLIAALFFLVLIYPYPARGQEKLDVEKVCNGFASDTVRLSAIRSDMPDEDRAHSLIADAVPRELWPTWHWMVRLIYREPAEKLFEAARRECMSYHGKRASGITTVLGIRG